MSLPHATVINSFCGPYAAGNCHRLFNFTRACNNTKNNAKQQALQNQPGNNIALYTHSGKLQAQFFSNGNSVLRCGSGTLAIATYLYEHYRRSYFTAQLHTLSGMITLGYDRDGPYYQESAVSQRPLRHLGLWRYMAGTTLVSGAYAGTAGDYCILQLPSATHIRCLRPNTRALTLFSRRALIAIAPGPHSIALRYFAPQYGALEDAATGSACVQAAAYLYRRTGSTHLHFNQLSAAGGHIHTQYRHNHITVRGRAKVVIESTANNETIADKPVIAY